MSSDILEPSLEDDHGRSIGLEMNAHGYAFLTIYAAEGEEGGPPLTLTPDAEGFAHAEAIERALSAWREQVRVVASMHGKDAGA
jgi:hypothetical protein